MNKQKDSWILVYTKPRQENRACINLQNQGFNTFFPLINSSNKNKEENQLDPVFPRYIFVEVNHHPNWTSIRSSFGVSKIVKFGEEIKFIPVNIINNIKSQLDQKNIYKENYDQSNYSKGDKLTIKKGRFSGVEAIFLSNKSNDRVRLLLSLLNTSIVTEVSSSDIGKKETVRVFKFED